MAETETGTDSFNWKGSGGDKFASVNPSDAVPTLKKLFVLVVTTDILAVGGNQPI
jgi:hypothetical protein